MFEVRLEEWPTTRMKPCPPADWNASTAARTCALPDAFRIVVSCGKNTIAVGGRPATLDGATAAVCSESKFATTAPLIASGPPIGLPGGTAGMAGPAEDGTAAPDEGALTEVC